MSSKYTKNDDHVNLECEPVEEKNIDINNSSHNKKDLVEGGSYKAYKDPKLENTATDVYYKTQCKLPESKVAVPTYDSVVEAKEWVDDENKM